MMAANPNLTLNSCHS
uniref:Uncharacterized protein n=1 Tax=Anguilla anguilla TaxID=7936 RepID=A0A0E9QLL5_ANGAN